MPRDPPAPLAFGAQKFLPIFHSQKFGQSVVTATKRQEMQGTFLWKLSRPV